MKLSDAVIAYLAERGIGHVFLVSGGGIMHLADSVGRHASVKFICNYHEQACVIAAEAYARLTDGPGACIVTTGPGATNAASSVPGAWFDSVPVLVISGQVRVPLIADYTVMRQRGPQEVNIIPMVAPVTKYAKTVRDPSTIITELDSAWEAATTGRPGPVWVDLPLDVQAADVEVPGAQTVCRRVTAHARTEETSTAAALTAELLRRARRPVLIAGHGVRVSGSQAMLAQLLEATQLPVLLPISAMDLVPESYPSHMGAFGPIGRRAANFALQNSDCLLSIGASLSIASTGFNVAAFAPKATKIVVNVDGGEIARSTMHIDVPVVADAGGFLADLLDNISGEPPRASTRWLQACAAWKQRYPPGPPSESVKPEWINSYALVEHISDALQPGEIIVGGISLDACSLYQSFRVKDGQRVLINANYGAMGWDLPAAVGACVAAAGRRVVLVTGDGSLQFNVQELLTVGHYRLNLKIFVLNNQGYESIRTTQANYFDRRFVGSDFQSGISNPNFESLAHAYGLAYAKVAEPGAVRDVVRTTLEHDGPILCEVIICPDQARMPRVSSFRRDDGVMESRPLEDMFPFLSRDEVHQNMHLFDDEELP